MLLIGEIMNQVMKHFESCEDYYSFNVKADHNKKSN